MGAMNDCVPILNCVKYTRWAAALLSYISTESKIGVLKERPTGCNFSWILIAFSEIRANNRNTGGIKVVF